MKTQRMFSHGALPESANSNVAFESHRRELSLDMGTRIAVLQRKANADRMNIPDEVLYYIASHTTSSNYELESALVRVVAYSSILNQNLSVNLAAQALNLSSLPGLARSASDVMSQSHMAEYNAPLGRRDLRSTRKAKREVARKGRTDLAGIVKGVVLSLIATGAMISTCLIMDILSHLMHILTPTIPWLWWTIISLNAMTVFIPIDVYRLRKSTPNPTARSRANLATFVFLELIIVAVFLFVLFSSNTPVIQVIQVLGIFN